jgi:hypothetical protein
MQPTIQGAFSWLVHGIITGVVSATVFLFVFKVLYEGAVRGFFEKQVEATKAEHQRLVHESGLYAREKHRAYARVYRRMRIATDSYAGLIGLVTMPDYSTFSIERIRGCLDDWDVSQEDPEAAEVLDAYTAAADYKGRQEAGRLMGKLDRAVRRRDADRRRIQFVNVEVLESLYLSDEVQSKLDAVAKLMGGFAVDLKFLGEVRPKVPLHEQRAAIDAAARDAYIAMRQELQRGDFVSR